MSITQEKKSELIDSFRVHEGDVGSAQVQIALLTERIQNLTGHFRTHAKDHHSRRGLLQMVSRRKRLLGYLRKTDFGSYKSMLDRLGLRK